MRFILSIFALLNIIHFVPVSASETTKMTEVKVVTNREEVIQTLVSYIEVKAKEAIEKNGAFNIGLSGGSLVSFLVAGLPKIATDFTKWKLFFCDERLVPVEDSESTFGVYKRQLLDTKVINLKEDQFIVVKQGVSPEEAAQDYEQQIKKYIPGDPLPQFDLLLLGMGPDGHTCSLFPGHTLLEENSRLVAPITDSPKPPPRRITLTYPIINNARMCIFAVSGKEKAPMIKRILVDKENLPAARVKPLRPGTVLWIVDEDAAGSIHY